MTPQVLVASRDPMLLQTRQLILGAFFEVHGAGRVREAEALMARFSFDLIILCSTLGDSDCRADGPGSRPETASEDSCRDSFRWRT